MKTIQQNVEQALQQVGQSKPRKSCAVDKANTEKAAKVWVAMSLAFGYRWEKTNGVAGESEEFWFWAKSLQEFSIEQIEKAIEKAMDEAEKTSGKGETPFPPDLFAFKSYCREPIVHPMNLICRAGPNKDYLREAGRPILAAIRKELRV